MNTDYTATKFAFGIFDLGVAYIKGMIRSVFSKESKRKSSVEILDDLDERVMDLEIKATPNHEEAVNGSGSNWETIDAVCERAKNLPSRGFVINGLIREGTSCNIQSVEKAGKSLLSMQIAKEYKNNECSLLIPADKEVTCDAEREDYIYDAELHDWDILDRYDNLIQSGVHRKKVHFNTPKEMLSDMRNTLGSVYANTLMVVDNASTICPTFRQPDIEELRLGLNELSSEFAKRGFWLTIIFVHHTKSGKDGGDTKDRAGSVQWGRVADDNISLLLAPQYGSDYRFLKKLNGRAKDDLLKTGETLLLKLESAPYPHFEFVKIITDLSDTSEYDNSDPTTNDKGKRDWTLNDEELTYAREVYVPDKYGPGRVAKEILTMRGWEITDSSEGNMKSSVIRALKNAGVYQPRVKK